MASAKPLAVTRPRKHARKGNAKLTRAQVLAAYRLYESGWSLPALGRALWQTHGYSSPGVCTDGLRKAFLLDGLQLRSLSAAMRELHAASGCAGCGGAMDESTPGCKQCRTRRGLRALRERRVAAKAEARRRLLVEGYASDAERLEARRESWRRSKRRAYRRQKAAA